eukprot:12510516-Alexandrium_andersonii.AAC.1
MLDRKAATGRSPELMLNVQEKCVDPQAYILVQRVLALHRAICLFPEMRQLLSVVVRDWQQSGISAGSRHDDVISEAIWGGPVGLLVKT